MGIRVGKRQPPYNPARSGTDGRKLQAVILEQCAKLARVNGIGRRGKDLDGVETERGRLATARRKVVPEDERTAACFLHQADRDTRFYGHQSSFPWIRAAWR